MEEAAYKAQLKRTRSSVQGVMDAPVIKYEPANLKWDSLHALLRIVSDFALDLVNYITLCIRTGVHAKFGWGSTSAKLPKSGGAP